MLIRPSTRWLALILLLAGIKPSPAGAAGPERADDTSLHSPAGKQQQGEGPASPLVHYEGKIVEAIELPGLSDQEREHLLPFLPQKAGEPLERGLLRDSIRALYATGRFADIQAEATLSGEGVRLTFTTLVNSFIGAVDVEGAPSRPNSVQIINAAKFQLGELYSRDKLDRAITNILQLMQEDGYHLARVTAEAVINPSTHQADVLFHVIPGAQAKVGEVNITGTSGLQPAAVESIAHLTRGDRVTSARVSDSLRRLRKRFQKQSRALAQVSIADQTYHPETNTVDFTFQIDPGPVVVIYAQGFRISRGVLKKEIPVYEENAVDDDLLNEGARNLLDYLQTRGHFDAKVSFRKESTPGTLKVIYDIDPGPLHKLVLVEITGNKEFLDTAKLRSYLQIQPSGTLQSHGRYSGALLKNDVATLEGLYRSNGFRQVQIHTKVDDDYKGAVNRLAVHIAIDEGPRTEIGEVHIVGRQQLTGDLPELSTQAGQPYSELELANDRERILNFYFNSGFPNATLDITTQPSAGKSDREDVTFTIREGERFTVARVVLAGTEHTRDYVVQREVEVHAGEPLSQQALLDTQTRLYNLGIFSQVDTAVQNPQGNDPQKNVLVQVKEAKRYTFTYSGGVEFQTGQPTGSSTPELSPRVGFDVTRLNFLGRNQTLEFQSHVGRLQQRGLIAYTIPELFNNQRLKLIYTIFYDNSLDVATFTSQRLEGKIDLRQQFGDPGIEPGTRPGPDSITYRFDFRRVDASNFVSNFSPGEIQLLSLPARVGGPGFTFIHDKRDNPLESTKGNYFTLDAFTASSYFGSQADYGRILGQFSTYYPFGGKKRAERQFVFARSTSIGLQQPFRGTHVVDPGACSINPNTNETTCQGFSVIPLPEQFFAGGGNSHRGYGLNQAGPRDPGSGEPLGGTALFVNSMELRFPETSLPFLGEGFEFAIFHDMGNVYTAQHDLIKGLLRWHQPKPGACLNSLGVPMQPCFSQFNNSGYDYTSHAVGLGVRYKTPIGPLRFDFGYNLNPTSYYKGVTFNPTNGQPLTFERQRLGPFNVFFSIGQPF